MQTLAFQNLLTFTVFVGIFLQIAKELQDRLKNETHSSKRRDAVSFSTADISNVLLLRLFNLVSPLKPTKSKSELKRSSGKDFVVHICKVAPQMCHRGDQCMNMGSHTTNAFTFQQSRCSKEGETNQSYLVPKKIFDKIQKKRNNLAHGGDVLVAHVFDSFQNVQRYFCSATGKQRDLLNQHLDKIQPVEEGIDILKKAMQSASHISLDIYTLPREQMATSRLFLSVARPELVGREDILKRLTILMTPPMSVESTGPHSTPRWPRVLLHGQPGVGKTAVVRELTRRLEKSHPHQHSFQAASKMTLLADIKLFLKLEMKDMLKNVSSPPESIFKDYLFQTKKSFFLAFEDVIDPQLPVVMPLLPKNKHCVIFTSSSDHSWKKLHFIPFDVISIPLQGLGAEDSFLLAAQVFADNGCKQLFRKICRNAAEMEHLRSFLSLDMMGLPLAVRLVAFQICQDGVSSIDMSALINGRLSEKRSSVDEKAAGRIHVQGFYHVVRYAITSMSNDRKALLVSFALSIFKCCGPPLLFLELLFHRLNFTPAEVHVCLERLMKTGLVTSLGEDYSMHQVVQNHIRTIVSSSFKEIKDSVVSVFLQIFQNETVLSTQVRLSKIIGRRRSTSITHRRMVRWCIRLTRLTLVCEVIRYRLVQVRQNQKKTFRVGGPQSPFSISSSFILSFVLLPFFLNTKMITHHSCFSTRHEKSAVIPSIPSLIATHCQFQV